VLLYLGSRYDVSRVIGLLASVLFQEFTEEEISESETRHVRLKHPRSEQQVVLLLSRRAGRRVFDMTIAVGTPAELDGEYPDTKKEPTPCDTDLSKN